MGAYLSSPVTEKESEEGEDGRFKYGVSAMQGWRTEMEDAHAALLDLDASTGTGFFGVFDGHGGKEVARYAALHLAGQLRGLEQYKAGELGPALHAAYLRLDELLTDESHAGELRKLAGDGEQQQPGGRRARKAAPVVMNEAALPEVLREALRAARRRSAARRARRGKGEGGGEGEGEGEDDDDEVEEIDMAELLMGHFEEGDEDDDEDDEADDPDFDPAEGGEHGPEELDPRELVELDIDTEEGASPPANAAPSPAPFLGPESAFAAAQEQAGGWRSEDTPEAMEGDEAGTEGAAGGKGKGEARSRTKRKRRSSSEHTNGSEGAKSSPVPNGKAASPNKGTDSSGSGEEAEMDDSSDDDSGEGGSGGRSIALARASARGASPAGQPQPYRGPSAGCTAVVAVVRRSDLWVANAGDSRCVVSRRGRALALTHDHKPTDAEEAARIAKAGGFVAEGRINGSLNLSRALGDCDYKQAPALGPAGQMVTAVPEVRHLALESGDEFALLACDGIWDVLSNQEAVDFVRKRLARRMSPGAICEAICDHCLAPDTQGCGKGCDNMSAMVVVLKPFSPFTNGDDEVDLAKLPPPPTDEQVDPMYHNPPDTRSEDP